MQTYIIFLRVHPGRLLAFFLLLLFTIVLLGYFVNNNDIFPSKGFWVTNRDPETDEQFCQGSVYAGRPLLRYDDYSIQKNDTVPYTFNCSMYKYLDPLGLGTIHEVPQSKDPSSKTVFLTAVSNPYREHILRLFYKEELIIVYDLGLQCETWHLLVELCGVEVRFFNYRKYPDRVRSLKEFRWKPIIIAETLQQFASVWYMDSSVVITKPGYLEKVRDLTLCRKRSQNDCSKSNVLLHSYTGHGIFAATDPYVYNYFSPKLEHFKTDRALMFEAGLIYWNGDKRSKQRILKWWVLCALSTDCMRNHKSIQRCKFSKVAPWTTFGNCHRYDQSVLNLLLFNEYNQNSRFYVSELTDFFKIQREVDPQDFINPANISCIGE